MPLDGSWTKDPAFDGDTAALHEYCKIRNPDGSVDRFEARNLWIEYPGAGSGPGAYGSASFSGFPGNFGRKGYEYPGFAPAAAVPLYDDGLYFDALFDTADELLVFPRVERRWTSVVPDPGDPTKAPLFTLRMQVFGTFLASQRTLIENFYPDNDWSHAAVDPALRYVRDLPLHELDAPAMIVELPGAALQEFKVADFPREDRMTLNEATNTTEAAAPGYRGLWVLTKSFQLSRDAIGEAIAVRTLDMAPANNDLSVYVRYVNSGVFSAEWAQYDPTPPPPPPAPPGVLAGGKVKTGVVRH